MEKLINSAHIINKKEVDYGTNNFFDLFGYCFIDWDNLHYTFTKNKDS